MIQKLLLTALALAVALAVPQPAVAQPAPGERAAAREFAYAAYRLRVKIKSTAPQARRTVARLSSRACATALGTTTQAELDRLPLRAQLGLGVLATEMELGTLFGYSGRFFPGFVAELDRIATADAALVAGREAWRRTARSIAQMRPVPADACAQVRRWRLAGFPLDGIPALQPPAIHAPLLKEIRSLHPSSPKPDRSFDRAAARLVELGVPRGQAERIAGDLFQGMPTTFVIESGTGDEV